MLVQVRHDRVRLFRQHDHALASGKMAMAWRDPRSGAALPFHLVLATALHDSPWRAADGEPRLDPESGIPMDFSNYPKEEKYAFLEEGIGEVARIHPLVGILVSRHHQAFLAKGALDGFQRRERARREVLRRVPGAGAEGEHDLDWLRFFDNLSLFTCLSPPGALEDAVPEWLGASGLCRMPGDGRVVELHWLDAERLALRPCGLPVEGLELELPYRDLEGTRFGSPEELRAAWSEAREESWRVRMVPG